MKTLSAALFASVLLTLVASGSARAQEELTCEDYRCEFQALLESECPCTEMDNHGRYVSCVAHIVKRLTEEGLPKNCKGKLKRCAARSVCGKEGFSTCTTYTYGTCVVGETGSFCDTGDGTQACTTNTDCIASQQCHTTRHQDECVAGGGVLDLSPTCCSNCTTTAP
jgi:hypothetical protein